ncbi:SGNH/GDSL hydrolase family protein [Alteromonas sp. IB21]|uniref:SGNH/GDSL hydrolase family protein n=1 Tax=Alteromonas sp. IB21 TaxID=2779369 RepID=UPI0018E70C1E|nr:SGNH/GDSL hydrolase family protein [Alteromonas sp. IB21]MBJ2129699.1 SGNH/GDSL hydrolase family protein [Alteromonas sp. IB21]
MIYFKVLWLNAAIILLLPIVFLQALWVRRITAVLPEPSGDRVLSSTGGKTVPKINILVIGDSAAAGVGAATQEGALAGLIYSSLSQRGPTRVLLHAKTGYKSEDVLNLLQQLPKQHFSTTLISIGVNDVTKFVSLRRWQRNISAIESLLSQKFGCQNILFTALPPIHAFPALPQPLRGLLGFRAFLLNKAMAARIASSPSSEMLYVRALKLGGTAKDVKQSGLMAEDGFHPSSKGYDIWARSALTRFRSS